MVKPMPPKKDTPRICHQFTPRGIVAIPVRTAIQLNRVIPMGLPTTSPSTMPSATGWVKTFINLSPKTTPAFERANIGIMAKATQGCRLCSSLCNGDSTSLEEFSNSSKAARCLSVVSARLPRLGPELPSCSNWSNKARPVRPGCLSSLQI